MVYIDQAINANKCTAKPKWQILFDESRNLIDEWEDQFLNDPDLKNLPDELKTKIAELLFSKFQKELTDFIENNA